MKPERRKILLIILIFIFVICILIIYIYNICDIKGASDAEPEIKSSPEPEPGISAGSKKTLSNYKLIVHEKAIEKIADYKKKLEVDVNISGTALRDQLKKLFKDKKVKDLTENEFIDLLLSTKLPLVFAESQKYGPSCRWSNEDARLLGNINVAMPVKVFDNGKWLSPAVHPSPFDAYLLFTPGALLVESCAVDYPEIVVNKKFDADKYYELYELRLLPLLKFANDESLAKGKKAVVTVPGIGCGLFSGNFTDILSTEFDNVLRKLLKKYSKELGNISLVYYGQREVIGVVPESITEHFNGIKYFRINSTHSDYKNLLESPDKFGPGHYDHILFAFVAWDHVSLPGNDFFGLTRHTDDGVKAAATSSMTSLLGVAGHYDAEKQMYLPVDGNLGNWERIAKENDFHLKTTEQVFKNNIKDIYMCY